MGEILRVVGALILTVLILYLSYVCTRYLGKGMGGKKLTRYMRIEDRIPLAQDKSVAVIQVGKRHFLIGIASSQINVLGELTKEDLDELPNQDTEITSPENFRSVLRQIAGRKGKS